MLYVSKHFWDSQVNMYVKILINIYLDALATKCRIATGAKQAWNRFIPCCCLQFLLILFFLIKWTWVNCDAKKIYNLSNHNTEIAYFNTVFEQL